MLKSQKNTARTKYNKKTIKSLSNNEKILFKNFIEILQIVWNKYCK